MVSSFVALVHSVAGRFEENQVELLRRRTRRKVKAMCVVKEGLGVWMSSGHRPVGMFC